MHVLKRRRCDGGRREDAMVLNPLGKVETAREGADSRQMCAEIPKVTGDGCEECIGKGALLGTTKPARPGCVL